MESKTTKQFRDLLDLLPAEIQKRAREAYSIFLTDPNHPGLRFKRAHSTLPVFSARVTGDYRAVGIIKDQIIIWFWIGSHTDYENLLKRL